MSTSIKNLHHGKTKYIQGTYYSIKNDCDFKYKSSYELAYLEKLEIDSSVLKYMYEPFDLYYIDSQAKQRIYQPDFMVLNKDGSILISEIKPLEMLKDYDVQAKAKAAREYIKEHYKDISISYCFVTEKDLFKSNADYIEFIKRVKSQNK